MAESRHRISEEIALIKRSVLRIKSLLNEDFELSDHARKALAEARATSESDYVGL